MGGGGMGIGSRDGGRSNDNYNRRDRDDNDRMLVSFLHQFLSEILLTKYFFYFLSFL
jgi:hypothetical protein